MDLVDICEARLYQQPAFGCPVAKSGLPDAEIPLEFVRQTGRDRGDVLEDQIAALYPLHGRGAAGAPGAEQTERQDRDTHRTGRLHGRPPR